MPPHDDKRNGFSSRMMNRQPLRACPSVSVIIPVFNRAQLVERAIRSVLEQSHRRFEIIVVDDGSTEDIVGALYEMRSRRLRLVSHDKNCGAATARNTGISKARGQYVAFLDSDDEWLPQKLKRQLAFMLSFDDPARLSCTASKVVLGDRSEGETRFAKSRITEMDMAFGCRISPGSTLMAEKSLFSQVGPMNEKMARLEDWDWLLRALRTSELFVLNEALSVIHQRNGRETCYHAVKTSTHIMRPKHFRAPGLFALMARLKFLAALENELAAAAYRGGRYGLALWHFMASLCYMPYRNLDTIRRIGSTIIRDIFQLGCRSERGRQQSALSVPSGLSPVATP